MLDVRLFQYTQLKRWDCAEQFGFDKVIGARINFIIIIVIIDIFRVTYAVKTIARTTVLEGR